MKILGIAAGLLLSYFGYRLVGSIQSAMSASITPEQMAGFVMVVVGVSIAVYSIGKVE